MSSAENECAVKIAVRERPNRETILNNEVPNVISYHSSNPNIIVVDERPFSFDHVLPPTVSQKELFESLIKPLVGKVLTGFNCTALAYGQTGTGKSFTMGLNPESFVGESVGMIPRCLCEILNNKNEVDRENFKQEIYASFIEIYSEKVYDLLSEHPGDPIIARGYKFTGGTKKSIANVQDGFDLLHQGTKNRHVRSTKMNPQSSRSHAIFRIYIKTEENNKVIVSCLNLVDLAGSEGVRRTGHQGVALSEGVHINRGLLSIGKVLQALTHGCKVIPYRDSMLSSVLQDSLNPNSHFTLLACISPHREDLSETLSTLRFAYSAKNLKHNPQVNSKHMEIATSKTPFKRSLVRQNLFATPTPYKRPLSVVNSKQSVGPKTIGVSRNTFCTPNKKKMTEQLKFNHTDVGLTPKEKQKIRSVNTAVPKITPFSFEPSIRESLLDRCYDTSHDSRASLFSLDISSSTAFEVQSAKPSTLSPLLRKYLTDIQSTTKVSVVRAPEGSLESIYPQKEDISSLSCAEQKLRTIIRQELLSLEREKKIEDIRLTDSNSKCELFRASSPIFKIPEVPTCTGVFSSNQSPHQYPTYNEHFLSTNQTVLSVKPLRRSRILSSMTQSLSNENSMVVPTRRSVRLSSVKSQHDARRRSIRIASKADIIEEENQFVEAVAPPASKSKSIKKTVYEKKQTKAIVNNSVIAAYFEEKDVKRPTNVKSALVKHQKAILEMLNNASMKELQYLPQIGLKTAFQIVTQRTLHGKFKTFAQVSKLPIWRGNAWERFKEANNIT